MRDVKKAIIAIVTVLAITINTGHVRVFDASAFDPGIEEIYSDSVFMVHLETEIPVFRKNEFERIWPASTTKIMTALVVLDNVENLNAFVRVTEEMNTDFGKDPNFTDAQAGDIIIGQGNLTYLDCLYALMIWSACDAANVLAYNVGGSIDRFVEMMNEKAAEIGCINTNFGNPHGLHQKDNYSCAYDLYKITQYVYEKHPIFSDIIAVRDYRMPANSRHAEGVVLPNTNRMLHRDSSYFYDFAKGVKTGSLPYFYDVDTGEYEPGNFSLVSIAARDGHTYMIVSLGAPYHNVAGDRGYFTYTDHLALYRWAFNSLEYKLILSENDIVAQASVVNGMEDRIQFKPAVDFSYLLPSDLNRNAVLKEVTLNFHDPEEQVFFAPIERGEVLGHVELMLAGESLTKISLIAATDVQMSLESRLFENVTGIFGEWWFQTGVALVAAMIILIIILRVINNQRAKNRRGSLANRNRKPRR
jgi:D-alanyl-D-alanine carboxypeptidase (penicillin-binding protein 5/6)